MKTMLKCAANEGYADDARIHLRRQLSPVEGVLPMRPMFVALALAVATISAAPAFAHPKLLSANPAANAVVAAPARLQLTFSESLVAQFSGAELAMTDMPGMKMSAPMKMTVKASLAPDGKTLILALAKPLPRGADKLDWHVVSTDTHRVQGSYVFKVK